MCFSISMAKTAEEIAEAFGVFTADIPPLPEYYHVSGFTYPDVPVLYNSKGNRKIKLMKWGLVPSWIKTEKDKESIRSKTLNARSETAHTLPSFRGSFKTGRCIITTDGFYEPHHREGNSYPYYIRRKDSGIIPLGGLYAHSKVNDLELLTFSIITVPASPAMAEIHNKKKRMPFIIPMQNSFINSWLNQNSDLSEVKELFNDSSVTGFNFLKMSEFTSYSVSKNIYKKNTEFDSEIREHYEYKELTDGYLQF